jgi:hypothetical protein
LIVKLAWARRRWRGCQSCLEILNSSVKSVSVRSQLVRGRGLAKK